LDAGEEKRRKKKIRREREIPGRKKQQKSPNLLSIKRHALNKEEEREGTKRSVLIGKKKMNFLFQYRNLGSYEKKGGGERGREKER